MISKKLMTFVSAVLAMGLLAGCNSGGSQSNKPSDETSTSTSTSTSISDSGSDTGSQTSSDQSSQGSEDSSSSDSSVEEKTVSQIIVKQGTSLPVSFVVGDTFSVEGGILQVRYSDSTREEIPMTLAMIENAPDMSVVHENYEVNVVYEGARTSYVINVVQGDTREEVSIGISYEYNNGAAVEITNFEEELVFTQGKSYAFHYGAYPSAAVDSLGRKYLTRAGEELEEKPTEIGEYTYKVYLAEGDEAYKPAVKTVNYKIIAPVIREFLLNNANAPTLTSVAGEATQTVDVAGNVCESGDLFARDRPLPDIEEGDILGILNAGAYGYTMASNYNSRPLPAEILVKNGESFVIREAQTFDDIFEKQSIPDHLQ